MKANAMKTIITLLILLAALITGGCATAARRQTALTAAHYGTAPAVLDKLELGQRLALADIEELGRRGVPDTTILAHLQRRGDAYQLTAAQITRLREAGVGDKVINYLLDSRAQSAWRTRSRYPVYRGGRGSFGHSGFGPGGFGGRHTGRHR